MQNLIRSAGIALGGLATSILTAVLVTLVQLWIGINLFTFSAWVFIPVGAIGCGLLAASGYFIAAKILHQNANRLLLFQMIVIAIFSQFLIYWLEYQTLVVDGGYVSKYINFFDYLRISITNAHMVIHGTMDTGVAVGELGYIFAFLDLLGFMVGAILVYLRLGSEAKCEKCQTYLRTAKKKNDRFGELDELFTYYDTVFEHPIDSAEFTQIMRTSRKGKRGERSISLDTILYDCPQCHQQSLHERVKVQDGQEMRYAEEYSRFTPMPEGSDIRGAFK
jgi:hypothetical protein